MFWLYEGQQQQHARERRLPDGSMELVINLREHYLLARSAQPLARHPAVAFALKEFRRVPHLRTISDVTEHIGLSSKRFIQAFSEEVGLTPKLFCRVRRFQEVLRRIEKGQQIEWTDIALTCGYFDQAHCIHDFRAFSGLNPTAYLTPFGEHRNNVPLGASGQIF